MFQYYEHYYHKHLHKVLTERWWILQGGSNNEALQEWLKVMKFLELDTKAMRDLFLLAQSGLVGRSHANKILWTLLSGPADDPTLPGPVEPGHEHGLQGPQGLRQAPQGASGPEVVGLVLLHDPVREGPEVGPTSVPTGPWYLQTGAGGSPLPPPECWGAPVSQ